jgi:hypothetical protein
MGLILSLIGGFPSWLSVVCFAFQLWSAGFYTHYLFWDGKKFSLEQARKHLLRKE